MFWSQVEKLFTRFLDFTFFFHSGAKLNVRYSSRLNRPYEYYSTVYGTSKVIDWAE